MSVSQSLSSSILSDWTVASTICTARVEVQEPLSAEEQVSLCFREFGDRVFRYLVHGCGNASDAEELQQETFLRLYRALKRQERIENVRCWIFKVARNLMLDRAKHLRRIAPKTGEMPADAADRVRDPSPTPEEWIFEAERRRQFWIAMQDLTRKQRDCLYLRSQGMQLREIGEVLDMDLRRVAEVLQRATTRLKRTVNA
jgi:RNA polymerase sigma-70 factor (ECF subfamily)